LNSVVGSPTIPDRVMLEKFTYVKGENVTLDGKAKSLPDMNEFSEDLEQSGHFINVTPNKGDVGDLAGTGMKVYNFSITGELTTLDKSKPGGAAGRTKETRS
jgi:hypothetical protein